MFDFSILLLVSAVQDLLASLPGHLRDQWLIYSLIDGATIVEGSGIDPLPQGFMKRRHGDAVSALAKPKSRFIRFTSEALEGIFSRCKPCEQVADYGAQNRIRRDDPFSIRPYRVDVTRRCERRVHSLGCFRTESLPNLLTQVVNVVLGHQDLDAMHELIRGPRILRQNHVLLHEMDLQVQLVNREIIPEIAIQTVGLLNQQYPAARMMLEVRNHCGKAGPAGRLSRLGVQELLLNHETQLSCVGTQQLLLRGNAIPLLLLLG